jgi:hypothetical protein
MGDEPEVDTEGRDVWLYRFEPQAAIVDTDEASK